MMRTSSENRKRQWVRLRPDLTCLSLPNECLEVVTGTGKAYRFGATHARALQQLTQGVELNMVRVGNNAGLDGALVMLAELGLLQYDDGQPAKQNVMARQLALPDVERRLAFAVAAVTLTLCAWQLGLLAWLSSRYGILPLPSISTARLLHSQLGWLLPFGISWIVLHELAHAGAARACGVRGGHVQWRRFAQFEFAFSAPPQPLLARPDVRFLIFCAGPACDLAFAAAIAISWRNVSGLAASQMHALFICHLSLGAMNFLLLGRSDMAQAMRALAALGYRPAVLLVLRGVNWLYVMALSLLAAKLLLELRM
jgi:hypothetical protein